MSSTAENMKFLEAQLDQYLHEHVSVSGILYIVPSGFRFPNRNWDTPKAMKENSRFLETQLSQYLHSHDEEVAS